MTTVQSHGSPSNIMNSRLLFRRMGIHVWSDSPRKQKRQWIDKAEEGKAFKLRQYDRMAAGSRSRNIIIRDPAPQCPSKS